MVGAKNAKIFANFFRKNIFKIITSVPGHPVRSKRMQVFVSFSCLLFLSRPKATDSDFDTVN
jgi:hypothetical protein